MDLALLLLRVAVGGLVAVRGAHKLLGWFGGHGPAGTARYLESLGWRPGRPYAWLLGTTEVAGGLALGLGLLTPLASAAVIGVMAAAIIAVHLDQGGLELPGLVAVGALVPALAGAGRWSLDHLLDWTLGSGWWGVAALVIGLVAAGAVDAARGIRVPTGGRRPAAA